MKQLTILSTAVFFLLTTLACGGLSLPTQAETEAAFATAQAFATQSAPTLEALRQDASALATQAAPTIEAALTQAATIAAEIEERGGNAQATLQAAGIDGSYLVRKVQALQPDPNGTVTFTITELEINLVLQARQLFATNAETESGGVNTAVEDGTIGFRDGLVVFEGDLLQPLAGRVQISFQPSVLNGQLQLQVVSAQVGNTAVPPATLTSIETNITSMVNPALAQLPNGITLKQITVGDGLLTLTAGR